MCRGRQGRPVSAGRDGAPIANMPNTTGPLLSHTLPASLPPWQEVQGLLGDTQAAFKMMMETVKEKEAATEALEGQLEGLRNTAEALRRARDEATAASQVRCRDGAGCAAPAQQDASYVPRCA